MHQTRNDPAGVRAGADANEAWWRVGMMWLVLGGPALVVAASLATAVLAYRGADPVVKQPNNAGPRLPLTGQGADASTPALLARNHAATARAPNKVDTPPPRVQP